MPARPGQALVAQEREHVPGTDEVVGANPTEGPTEAIRLDQEPVPKTGGGREALGRSSRPASSTPRWSRGQDTGPSTRRPGFDSPSRCSVAPATNVAISVPGSRTARRPAVTRKVGVRAPPWQPPPGGRGSRRTAADRVTGVKVPPGRPSHTRTRHIATQVVVVQRRGSRHATPGMRVRIPPATPTSTTPAGEVLTARTLAS